MDYLKKVLKKTGYISIIESILFIILGIILMVKSTVAIKAISIIIGLLLIICGLFGVIQFLREYKSFYDSYNYDLIGSLMFIIIGILVIYFNSGIELLIRLLIGLWIAYSAVVKFTLSIKIKQVGSKAWFSMMIISLIMLACGIYVIVNSGAIISTIGLIIIINSILDIIEDVVTLIKIREII